MNVENSVYPLNLPGYCLILNNKSFNSSDLSFREGSEKDVENLKNCFNELNYNVVVKENLNEKEIIDLLDETSKNKDLLIFDIFVFFLMSHGSSEGIIGSDSQVVNFTKIIEYFNNQNCKFLNDKPKIFFFNCCRSYLG